MHARSLIAAAAALALSSSVAAEPPKAPADASKRSASVVLASADHVVTPGPAPEETAPAPVKRPRAARVTTSRCGDPQAGAQDQEQQ